MGIENPVREKAKVEFKFGVKLYISPIKITITPPIISPLFPFFGEEELSFWEG